MSYPKTLHNRCSYLPPPYNPQGLSNYQDPFYSNPDNSAQLPVPFIDTVVQAINATKYILSGLSGNSQRDYIMGTAFGQDYNQDSANQILTNWAQNNFTNTPHIELVSGQNFNGAYAKANNTIYLSQEFVGANKDNVGAVTGVLVEEFGHYLDSQINVQDAAGDEGDIFSRLVRGQSISAGELLSLKVEDDHGVFDVNGQAVAIEKADLKQYWFWYNFNGSNYLSADSYRGSVIAPVGTYQQGQNYFDPSSYNENWTRGAYYITNVTEYDDYKTWDNGKVWVEEYVDRDNGTPRTFSTAKYSNGVTPAGSGYLGSETDYIVVPGVAQNDNLKFGQRWFEADPPSITSGNWKAEFFNNINRTGSPVLAQDWGNGSQNFSRNWGNGSPGFGVNPDNFSARVTTQRYFAPGRHEIQTTSDDGVKVNIAGQTIIDRLVDQATGTNTGVFDAGNGGTFNVIVDYYERTGGANLSFNSRLLPPSVVNLAANQTLSGQLSTSDRNNPTLSGRYSDDYRLTGVSAGQQVRLDMTSSFDTYLQLVNESTGQVINYNDDSNGTYNSQITFTAQAGISYIARATSYNNGVTGSYNISANSAFPNVPSGNWKAEFFNNLDRTGSPVLVQDLGSGSQSFSRDWGLGSPGAGVNADNFSVRVTTQRYFAAGRHQIQSTSSVLILNPLSHKTSCTKCVALFL